MFTYYKLRDYKISQIGGAEMWWEAHHGFAASRQGRCKARGQVLLLGPHLHEEPAAFKGDFLDSIKPFPVWSRTEFCCERGLFFSCGDGRGISWDEIAALEVRSPVSTEPCQGSFNLLSRYEIICCPGSVSKWKAASGARQFKQGKALVLDDILFMEPGVLAPFNRPRGEFTLYLQRLPFWSRTPYFATQAVVTPCSQPKVQSRAAEPKRVRTRPGVVVKSRGGFLKALRLRVGQAISGASTRAGKLREKKGRVWRLRGRD